MPQTDRAPNTRASATDPASPNMWHWLRPPRLITSRDQTPGQRPYGERLLEAMTAEHTPRIGAVHAPSSNWLTIRSSLGSRLSSRALSRVSIPVDLGGPARLCGIEGCWHRLGSLCHEDAAGFEVAWVGEAVGGAPEDLEQVVYALDAAV